MCNVVWLDVVCGIVWWGMVSNSKIKYGVRCGMIRLGKGTAHYSVTWFGRVKHGMVMVSYSV